MMPPTSIDGTDITGATIDGTDVTEITVDGQTVFSAAPTVEPVGYSNLVAWYPFDPATYGGSNADDVTALFNSGQSGDSTAYDGTVSGATFQSSGGVTDINAGANSGGFEFDGSNDHIDLPNLGFSGSADITVSVWFNIEDVSVNHVFFYFGEDSTDSMFLFGLNLGQSECSFFGNDFKKTHTFSDNTWHNQTATFDSSTNKLKMYNDGALLDSATMSTPSWNNEDYAIGYWKDRAPPRSPPDGRFVDGNMDDLRIYDTVLTASQISDIYTNTKP